MENKLSYSVISFCNDSLSKNIFCNFSGNFHEKTTFEEFVEFYEQKINIMMKKK